MKIHFFILYYLSCPNFLAQQLFLRMWGLIFEDYRVEKNVLHEHKTFTYYNIHIFEILIFFFLKTEIVI